MSGLILLHVSAAPPCKKPLSTVGSKPLACNHLSASTKAGTLLLCMPMSLSPQSFQHLQSDSDCHPLVKAYTVFLMALSCVGLQ